MAENFQIVRIPTTSPHEKTLNLLSDQLQHAGMYKCVACPLCKCPFSSRCSACECGQTSFPYLEIRYATAGERCGIAEVTTCEECGLLSDSAYDECRCGGTGISYILYIPRPNNKIQTQHSEKAGPIPPTPIDF